MKLEIMEKCEDREGERKGFVKFVKSRLASMVSSLEPLSPQRSSIPLI